MLEHTLCARVYTWDHIPDRRLREIVHRGRAGPQLPNSSSQNWRRRDGTPPNSRPRTPVIGSQVAQPLKSNPQYTTVMFPTPPAGYGAFIHVPPIFALQQCSPTAEMCLVDVEDSHELKCAGEIPKLRKSLQSLPNPTDAPGIPIADRICPFHYLPSIWLEIFSHFSV